MNKYRELVDLLISHNYKIATAESCTGGMIASKIIDIPDASKVLDVSFVVYANEAKIKYLNVDPKTIEKYGVVSEEVTYQMAKGLLAEANSNVAVVTSGVAGPTGGSDVHPVGMVCFGIAIMQKIVTFTEYFGDIGRNEVREKSANFIIQKLIEMLK